MSRDGDRLTRLRSALEQARQAAEAEAARSMAQLDQLRQQQSEVEQALARQHALADLLFSASLSRLAALGLRIASGEAELAALQKTIVDLAMKLKLVGRRISETEARDAERAARLLLEELAARRAWQKRASLGQGP